MALNCGIVGLPNVGKSTLFNALTSAKADVANYPFCTIDPNVGVVKVPDERLDKIAKIVGPQKVVPTIMEFVDIAGLIKGASKGEGKGNAFLQNIRDTDAIIHVVRCFVDDNIQHVMDSVDPLRDIEVINTELLLADLKTVENRYTKIEKVARTVNDPKMKAEAVTLKKVLDGINNGIPARAIPLSEEELPLLAEMHLITAKPMLYMANVDEAGLKTESDLVKIVRAQAEKEKSDLVTICGALEMEIAQLPPEDRQAFLTDMGLNEPGLNRLIRAGYKLLNLVTYFTAGVQEVRAWTIINGTKAPGAAAVIHSDFEKGFIRAETYNCDDLFKFGTEAAVKEKGLYRSEGKEYLVKDGDILFFRFNV